ncbi:hypothetical protein SVAN01_02379 [Stagonosporopsis vannaccii]|nr:hypothetical protein SVAN01_02379 [Stagonosporopsis vannaccii]
MHLDDGARATEGSIGGPRVSPRSRPAGILESNVQVTPARPTRQELACPVKTTVLGHLHLPVWLYRSSLCSPAFPRNTFSKVLERASTSDFASQGPAQLRQACPSRKLRRAWRKSAARHKSASASVAAAAGVEATKVARGSEAKSTAKDPLPCSLARPSLDLRDPLRCHQRSPPERREVTSRGMSRGQYCRFQHYTLNHIKIFRDQETPRYAGRGAFDKLLGLVAEAGTMGWVGGGSDLNQ